MSEAGATTTAAAPAPAAAAAPNVPFFKKKGPKSRANIRQRTTAEEDGGKSSTAAAATATTDGASSSSLRSGSAVVRQSKKEVLGHPLVQGTKRLRDKEERERDRNIFAVEWEGSGSGKNENRNYATRDIDWDLDEEEKEREREKAKRARSDDDNKRRDKQRGPVRAPANIRSVTVVDYQPDVCKDYKETGFCGFGDTCKFLHDRGDYLHGWQLDGGVGNDVSDAEADDSEEEDVPFACLICRRPFTDPVVTLCGHYFCSACAIKRYAKTPKCFACGKPTQGVFNSATKVLKRMEARKKAREEERAERRGGGLEGVEGIVEVEGDWEEKDDGRGDGGDDREEEEED